MRYLFLLNPAAGRQDSTKELEAAARAALARAGVPAGQWSIRRTAYKGHARELARAAAAAGGEITLFAAGGDGTFNEVLTGAKGCPGAAVGCIPAGSGNDFLRTFGTKADFLDLDAQLAGRPVTIDLMDTTLGLSAAVCAAGLDAQVANGAAAFRHNPLFHGEAAYLLSALRQICGPLGRRFRFEADGQVLEEDVLLCAVCNTKDYGGGFRAAPNARPDDGWLDLVAVRRAGRLKILSLLGCYKQGRHFDGDAIAPGLDRWFIHRRVKEVKITFPDGRGPVIATADGECAPVEKLSVRVLPGAARVVLPAGVRGQWAEAAASAAK